MRVIQQIIEYLTERGSLTDEEVRYLRTEGFAPYPTEYAESAEDTDAGVSPYDDIPTVTRARRKGRRARVPANSLTVGQLKAGIAARIGDWAAPLAGLIALARRLDSKANIITAPLAIIQADADDLFAAVQDAVDTRQPSLKNLWVSLDFGAFREPSPAANGMSATGPTARAYRFLLRALRREDAPGCGWLLRYWQVRWAVQVAEAQRRILAALGALYDANWNLVSRELSRERHDGAFWAFTLLYNARRFAEGVEPGVPASYADERVLASLPPDPEDWLRAWSQAALMDKGAVVPFLAVHGTEIGLQAVSVGKDGAVILWNTRTGAEIRRFPGHTGAVSIVLFTPDGKRMLTGSADGTARLWHVTTGRECVCFDNRSGNADPAWCACFSPDGRLLATGSGDSGKVYIWDVATGKRLRAFPASGASTWSVAWSPDGRYLVAAGTAGVRLYDPATGRKVRSLFTGEVGTAVAISPDGRYITAGTDQGKVLLWVNDGTPPAGDGREWGNQHRVFYQHERVYYPTAYHAAVQWVAFSAYGHWVVSAGDDGVVKAVALGNYRQLFRLEGRHKNQTYCVALSPDETQVLTTGADGTVRLWDLETSEEIRVMRGHTGNVWCAAFRPGTLGVSLVCPTRWDKTY